MTKANDVRPTRREVLSKYDGVIVAEITARTLKLRPKGCRRGGPAEITVTWGSIFNRALADQAAERAKQKRRGRLARRP